MSFFRHHGACLVGAVAGVAAGAGFCVLYFRLQKEIDELRTLISQLQQELAVAEREGRRAKRNQSGYFTCTSDDDDDDFQDALGGTQSLTGLELDIADDQFYLDIDDLLDGSKADIQQAYTLLQERRRELSSGVQFQWRLAKTLYLLATHAGERGDTQKKRELMYKAKDTAEAALQLDSSCSEAHKWFAITLGCVGDYETTSEKIKSAVVIKDHIQMAIKLNPSDPTPHHMLGRWCFSVYMLSWLERKAASALFGTPPTSTAEEALEHFMQAENLNPGKWKANMLYIAKCLIEKGEYDEAGVWLRRAATNLDEDSVDEDVKAEITSLHGKYGR